MSKIKVKFKEWDCVLQSRINSIGTVDLWLDDANDGESIATCTVDLRAYGLRPPPNQVFIKEYSEGKGMTQALIDAKVISPDFQKLEVGDFNSTVNNCRLLIKIEE